jgi:hypothetical protein
VTLAGSQAPPGQLPAPLTLRESVPLVHALVAHLAQGAGVRILFIKGPVLARQNLRGDDHTSVDVDVLVSPEEFGHLCRALAVAGWRDEQVLERPSITPQHSATYRHESWECAVDVHRLFPGFLADPQTVFDALWRSRTSVDIAGREVPTCARPGNAALAALHYLRDSTDPHRAQQLDELVALVRGGFGPESLTTLSLLSVETGAADTLRPFLERVGAPLPTAGLSPADAWSDWRLRSETPDLTSLAWLMAVCRRPIRRRPRLLWHALFLSEADLRANSPSLPPGRLPVAIARVARLRRGMRALPSAVSALRRARSAA